MFGKEKNRFPDSFFETKTDDPQKTAVELLVEQDIILIVFLLLIALLSVIFFKWLKIPYMIGLLIGITVINLFEIMGAGTMIILLGAVGILAVLIGRIVVVYGMTAVYNCVPGSENIGIRYQHVLFWGGLRGGVGWHLRWH